MTPVTGSSRTNSGHHLSLARRFVIAPNTVVADGVMFTNGVVVLVSRQSEGVEVYHGGVTELPDVLQEDLEWIDALRPPLGA